MCACACAYMCWACHCQRVFDVVDDEDEQQQQGQQRGNEKRKRGAGEVQVVRYKGKRLVLKLEANPKWQLLRDVIEEVEETRKQVAAGPEGALQHLQPHSLGPTLVIVRDDNTASQVNPKP